MTSSRNATNEKPIVLLVDDDDFVRGQLEKILERKGLRVIPARSALHAEQVLEVTTVDLVVADLLMPGPSGLRLLERVSELWPKVGRILLTGYVSPEARHSPAVDMVLEKGDDALFMIQTIVSEARRRHDERRRAAGGG